MNFIVCIVSIIGIILNCFVISSTLNDVSNVDNVDKFNSYLCSNDEILTDNVDNF